MKIEFNSLAEKEFLAAIRYYEKRSRGLGRRFRNVVEKTLESIQQFPELAREVRPEIRIKHVQKKFPYSIIYSVRKDSLYIVSVMHQKRNPTYWYSRVT